MNTEGSSHCTLSFIEEWCKYYGLDSEMARYLRCHGYTTGDNILTLYVDDIKRLPDVHHIKKCLLRGAILQYRQDRLLVDRELEKKGVVLKSSSEAPVKKRNMRSVWRYHVGNIKKMDAAAGSIKSNEEKEEIHKIDKRKKKQSPRRKTLQERIQERRQIVLEMEKMTSEELSKKLDGMLEALLKVGFDDPVSDDLQDTDIDLTQSRKKTEEAMCKLEEELFTEEEKVLIANLKQLQKKFSNSECAEYYQELGKLIENIK